MACMNRLMGDLVDETSLDTGKLAGKPHPGDIAELISEAVIPFAQAAEERGSLSNSRPVVRRCPPFSILNGCSR